MGKPRKDHFAQIPVTVLESAACATLPLAAFKVLVILASGYRGTNNGTMACTESWARKYGIMGTDTVRRSLKELEARGLIELTRRGMKMRKIPSLWALTWQSIDNRNGQPIGVPAPASHRYAKYDGYIWHEERKKIGEKKLPGRWIKNSHPYGGVVSPLWWG